MGDDDSLYRSLCSSLTLQSEKRGFFQEFADTVTELVGKEWLRRFVQLENDIERIKTCFLDQKTKNILQETLSKIAPLFRSKSAPAAKSKITAAYNYDYQGDRERAIIMASQAIARAPAPGPDDEDCSLAIALWVRAKLYFSSLNFEMALSDIQLALKYGIQDELKLEAYWKMAHCYIELGEREKAMICLKIASKIARERHNPGFAEEAEKVLSNLPFLVKTKVSSMEKAHPVLTNGSNENYPNASSNIGPIYTEKAGRSMTAKNKIEIGDTLVVESPYAAALFIEKTGTHCLNCFTRIKRMIPCLKCSGVAFCSSPCHDAGMKYHQYECPYGELLMGSGMSISCYLALRIVSQNSLSYFLDIRENLEDPNFKHPYINVYRLETHIAKREPKDLLHRTLMAHFLLGILKNSGYFGNNVSADILTEEEAFIGSLISRHIQNLQYNAHEVYETIMRHTHDYRGCKTVNVGLAVYPTVALFNHECNPAVTRYFDGTKIIIRAVRPIEPGETVSENYGPVFTIMDKVTRQRSLSSRYLFVCNCIACTQNWPKINDISTIIFKCQTPGCHKTFVDKESKKKWECPSCKKKADIRSLHNLYVSYNENFEEGIGKLDRGEIVEASRQILCFMHNMMKIVQPPNRNLSQAQEALRTIWALNGNLFVL